MGWGTDRAILEDEGFNVTPQGNVAPTVSVTPAPAAPMPQNIRVGTGGVPYSGGAEALRALVGQGMLMGTGEELEAAVRAPFSDEDYKTIRDRLRAQQQQFQTDNPVAGTALDVVGGLALPAGMLGSAYKAGKGVLQMVKSGAGAGAATGAVTGAGVAPEMSDIPMSAAGYGAAGAALGGTVPAAFSLGGKLVSNIVDALGFTNANKVATRKLAEYMEKDNLTPNQVQDMLNEYRRVGVPDPVIADIGENLRGAGYASYIVPSKAKGTTEAFLEGRNADMAASLAKGLEQKAGVRSQGKFGFDYIDEVATAQEAAAKKAYPKAYTQDIPAAPFRKYVDRDIFAKAYDEAKRRADVYGNTLPELSQIRNAQFISTQIMHDIKRGLDDVIEKETDKVTGKMSSYGADVARVKKEFNDLIKYYNKDYAQANSKFADFAKLKGAYADGVDYMKMETSELVAKLKKMTPAEKESFRVGMISDIRNKLANFKGGDPSRLVFKSDRQKQSLKYAFDDEGQFNDFVRQVEYQNNLLKTQKKVLGGSPTQERAMLTEDLGTAAKAARGDFLGAIADVARRGTARAGGVTPDVAERMQNMLFNPSAQGQSEILRQLQQNMAKQGGRFSNPVTYGGLLGEQSALMGQ